MRLIHVLPLCLAVPGLASAGALTGAGSGLRCTDFATKTFEASFNAGGTCEVSGRPGTSGFVAGERLCRVPGREGGDLRVGPQLSFTWDRAGPITVVDGKCTRI